MTITKGFSSMSATPTQTPTPTRRRNRSDLTDQQRSEVVAALLQRSQNGALRRGALTEVAALFNVLPLTISRLWKRAKASAEQTGSYNASSRKYLSGRKAKNVEKQLELLRNVPEHERLTVRAAAAICGLPVSTIHRRLKADQLPAQGHARVTGLPLTDENKAQRLQFCLSHIDRRTLLFDDMFDVIHVDERQFHLDDALKHSNTQDLLEDNSELRALRRKNGCTKVVVLAAVARPRWDRVRNRQFDGKLGLWAFTDHSPAARSSKNRPAGASITHKMAVTTASYRSVLTTKLLPAIAARWPQDQRQSTITIRQDHAASHIDPSDTVFGAAIESAALPIRLEFHPSVSPDFNVLDLGIFSAIQTRQQKQQPRTLDELVASVSNAFDELPVSTIDAAFLSLQCIMNTCIEKEGGNDYKPNIVTKAQLEREGRLPASIRCSPGCVRSIEHAANSTPSRVDT